MNSRLKNTVFNFFSSIGGQLITLIMQFVIRTVFISTLGKQYLGIEGLFSNILMMLTLVELGVGSAITFKLYDPLAVRDSKRIAVLMHFYKKMYQILGLIIGLIGLALIPFLPYLINDYQKLDTLGIRAGVIFVLYLSRTVSTYLFFAYKSAIIKADQKEYLINIISYVFTFLAGVLQIVCLILFKNFILYVVISILQVIAQNIVCAILSDRMYPFIREFKDEKMDREEVRGIFKDCSALLLYKLYNAVVKGADNIILSIFKGLDIVAMYSNYLVIYAAISSLFKKIFDSVSHSIGNLHTTHDIDHEYFIFEVFNLVTAILGGTAFTGVFCVADEMISVWIGEDWVFPQPFSFLVGIEMYTLCIRLALSKYRSSMGLFQQAKFRPLAGMIINLVISVWLVHDMGIVGVLIGTVIADWTTFMWYDPIIIHRYGFEDRYSVFRYFRKLLYQIVVIGVVCTADFLICAHCFTGHGWFSLMIHIIICGITIPVCLLLASYRFPEGKYLIALAKGYEAKLIRKMKG